jgi:hypothetical protein
LSSFHKNISNSEGVSSNEKTTYVCFIIKNISI